MAEPAEDMARILAQGARPRRRWLWVVLVVAVLAAAGGWYWVSQRNAAANVSYQTAEVSRGTLVLTVTATGSVQPTTQVDVSSELSGALTKVAVDFNDRVAVGQVLALLDDSKLKDQVLTARAQLQSAQAGLEQAEAASREALATYDTQSELERRGQAARNSLISIEAARDKALAAADGAKADVALAQSRLSEAETELGKAVIRSPIAGVVLNRAAEPGQIVAASLNAPVLFTLAEDLARMELRVNVDEADIGRVAVGNEARFTVDAFPARSFPARITTIRYAPETTDGVVTYKAILSVDNAEGLLRPGMTATATIAVTTVTDTLQVPSAALRFEPPQATEASGRRSGGGLLGLILPRRPAAAPKALDATDGASVWVLRKGVATEVAVTSGESDGKLTAITSPDLVVGDAVIIDQRSGS